MALVGYARVSSVGQRLDVQVEKRQHCDKLFQEHTSGLAATRPRLADCLEYGVEQAVVSPAAILITATPVGRSCRGRTVHTG